MPLIQNHGPCQHFNDNENNGEAGCNRAVQELHSKQQTHVARIAKTARSQFSNGKCGDPTNTGSNQSTTAAEPPDISLQVAVSWSLKVEQPRLTTIVMFR
ncbi:hypothetical protein MTR_1g090813 [Medicago truncatula]|uniref:Uncharacterized protein n=1 Tax=Medicago truncatula TaxID=3880 RepID=A0A072VNE9_MEDTR|nr:hypothetical protein MTR_1g090813 [Medicago truncatula]